MVRSSLSTPTLSVFQRKLNKIEVNILLASSLGRPADFKQLLQEGKSGPGHYTERVLDTSPISEKTTSDDDDVLHCLCLFLSLARSLSLSLSLSLTHSLSLSLPLKISVDLAL